jgi:hypothetical protein
MDPFDSLQQKLIGMLHDIGSTLDEIEQRERTVVVVPSLAADVKLTSSAQQAYEERLLFLLFLLRKPGIRLIFVTSLPVQPNIVEYYLNMLPGVVISNARKRLFLVSTDDGSRDPLTQKLLSRPNLIRQIRALIPDANLAHMVPFMTTDRERELAVQLGIPMYAADPRFFVFGTKSGCRRVFAEEGLQHPLGVENLYSVEALIAAITRLRAQRKASGHPLQRVVIKLNEGVSGLGNAMLDLGGLPDPGAVDETATVRAHLQEMRFESSDATYEDYMASLANKGAIVEEFIAGVEVRSPSAQLRVTPLGEIEMLSTHDQMLGGPSGQSYLGARFPADPAYSGVIMRDAAKIGARFAREGIVGRFAVDFVVVRRADGTWDSYAIEVNLRKGGTTAPFLILQYLTDGTYDAQAGVFTTAQGQPKYYVASDHLESPAYRVFTTQLLFDLVSDFRLHFNHATQTGVVMHMITGVAESGRVGVTAIADSPEDASTLYREFVAVLDREAAILLEKT